MKILLVDDHFVVREGLAALLRGLLPDVEVSEAGDGEEALQAVQREIPSLVIVDLGLPGISGLELTRRLRQRLPQLRVLFFSLHDELARTCRRWMASSCCAKRACAARSPSSRSS